MKTSVPEDNLDNDSDELNKDYVEIRRPNEYLNVPRKNVRSSLSDTDFVRDGKQTGLRLAPLFRVIVEKEDEERDFIPLRFLELVLENYCILADQTEDINEKMDIFIKAENKINKYIREFELKHFALEFAKIFDDINDQIKKIEKYQHLKLNTGNTENNITKSIGQKKLSLQEIGFLFAYKNGQIDAKNSDAIAKEFGHNSGHKLAQWYGKYQLCVGRTSDEGSDVKNKNRIKLFEKIIDQLTGDTPNQQKAIKELKEFKKAIGK